jgi:hypothetical protein
LSTVCCCRRCPYRMFCSVLTNPKSSKIKILVVEKRRAPNKWSSQSKVPTLDTWQWIT